MLGGIKFAECLSLRNNHATKAHHTGRPTRRPFLCPKFDFNDVARAVESDPNGQGVPPPCRPVAFEAARVTTTCKEEELKCVKST